MSTTTHKLIAKTTLGSSTSSVTFTSIPGTYTDLCLVFSARCDRADTVGEVWMRLNGAANNNGLSTRLLSGNGSSASSASLSRARAALIPGSTATSDTFSNAVIYIPNYAASTAKSWSGEYVSENNTSATNMAVMAGSSTDTNAITSIELLADVDFSHSMISGSSFFLYGITKA